MYFIKLCEIQLIAYYTVKEKLMMKNVNNHTQFNTALKDSDDGLWLLSTETMDNAHHPRLKTHSLSET
jgi:hypothetical protein